MDTNKILTPVLKRILSDNELKSLASDPVRAIKGPRKPTGMENPSFTAHVLSAPLDEDGKFVNGTLQLKVFVDDHASGNADVETMGPILERLVKLFDDQVLPIEGFQNYNLVVAEVLGPMREAQATTPEGQHFGLLTCRFGVIPR